MPAATRERSAGCQLRRDPAQVSQARRLVRATLAEWGLDDYIDHTVLISSELTVRRPARLHRRRQRPGQNGLRRDPPQHRFFSCISPAFSGRVSVSVARASSTVTKTAATPRAAHVHQIAWRRIASHRKLSSFKCQATHSGSCHVWHELRQPDAGQADRR